MISLFHENIRKPKTYDVLTSQAKLILRNTTTYIVLIFGTLEIFVTHPSQTRQNTPRLYFPTNILDAR